MLMDVNELTLDLRHKGPLTFDVGQRKDIPSRFLMFGGFTTREVEKLGFHQVTGMVFRNLRM
jgi:hypothetical protein